MARFRETRPFRYCICSRLDPLSRAALEQRDSEHRCWRTTYLKMKDLMNKVLVAAASLAVIFLVAAMAVNGLESAGENSSGSLGGRGNGKGCGASRNGRLPQCETANESSAGGESTSCGQQGGCGREKWKRQKSGCGQQKRG